MQMFTNRVHTFFVSLLLSISVVGVLLWWNWPPPSPFQGEVVFLPKSLRPLHRKVWHPLSDREGRFLLLDDQRNMLLLYCANPSTEAANSLEAATFYFWEELQTIQRGEAIRFFPGHPFEVSIPQVRLRGDSIIFVLAGRDASNVQRVDLNGVLAEKIWQDIQHSKTSTDQYCAQDFTEALEERGLRCPDWCKY